MAQLDKASRQAIAKQLRNEAKKIDLSNSTAISALRDKVKLPKGYQLKRLNQWFKDGAKGLPSVTEVTAKTGMDSQTFGKLNVPGKVYKGKYLKEASQIHKNTLQFLDRIRNLGYDDAQIDKYLFETDNELRNLINTVARQNKKLPKGKKISFGHLNRLSESINSPRNVFLEFLTENIKKGDRYSENPAAMIAIGNPTKEGVGWLENWTRDFNLWADRPENGGSGVLPQRGDFGSAIERQIHSLTGNQFDSLDEAGKIDAVNQIDDFYAELDKRNPWLPSENKQLKKWGILSPEGYDQALAHLNDNEAKYFTKPKGGLMNTFGSDEITANALAVGERSGKAARFAHRATKVGTGLSRSESMLRIAGGDVVGGSIGLAMTTPTFQKQIGRLLAKQGIKMIPGMSFGSGALQAAGYALGGQWTKAGLSALGGVIGELGPAGDAVQAAIDLSLEASDQRTKYRTHDDFGAKSGVTEGDTKLMKRFDEGFGSLGPRLQNKLLRGAKSFNF